MNEFDPAKEAWRLIGVQAIRYKRQEVTDVQMLTFITACFAMLDLWRAAIESVMKLHAEPLRPSVPEMRRLETKSAVTRHMARVERGVSLGKTPLEARIRRSIQQIERARRNS